MNYNNLAAKRFKGGINMENLESEVRESPWSFVSFLPGGGFVWDLYRSWHHRSTILDSDNKGKLEIYASMAWFIYQSAAIGHSVHELYNLVEPLFS